jgi:hypothetical protein
VQSKAALVLAKISGRATHRHGVFRERLFRPRPLRCFRRRETPFDFGHGVKSEGLDQVSGRRIHRRHFSS